MDREYLEDYEQKERSEYERLERRIQEGEFSFEKDRYPPDERFVKLQEPVAWAANARPLNRFIWAQVPFCGSLIFGLPPIRRNFFEEHCFKVSEIPKLIDFAKETGKLQIVLTHKPTYYIGLDHLELFFKELNPPIGTGLPLSVWANEKDVRKAEQTFFTLGRVSYFSFLRKIADVTNPGILQQVITKQVGTYLTLKLGHYSIVEDIENSMIDDHEEALSLLSTCQLFIVSRFDDLRGALRNFSFRDIRAARILPLAYQPQEMRFSCEIGKFLIKKLTHAPLGLRACYDLIDHYAAYDLPKVQKSLNEAIVTNHPDIVDKSAQEFSEILENVWNDPAIPRQIKNLKRGLPMSIAAIGSAVSAFTGGIEGFLAGLGFSVGTKFLDAEIEGLSEKIVKFFARSYQANVYDFKKKYEHRIVK